MNRRINNTTIVKEDGVVSSMYDTDGYGLFVISYDPATDDNHDLNNAYRSYKKTMKRISKM